MDPADLAFADATRQAELVRTGAISPRELVQAHLDRIERLDPQLNAFRIVLAERALAEADQAAARARARAGAERPLLGVPVAVKDNLDVVGEVTTHGTAAHGGPAAADAAIVRRLRAAGAIVIGKTHMSELALWPFTESLTWGVTRNPWDTARTCGGSSGGSAVAVAAGLAALATASDGGGSIRIPAAYCGLFGLKPQRGRVSLAPLDEHWHGLSVAGTVTRSVRDSALFLDVVAGGGHRAPPPPERPFAQAAETAPVRLRIAVSFSAPGRGPLDRELRSAVEATADLLRSVGHEVREQEPDHGVLTHAFLPRYARGTLDEAATLPHPERLERRTRAMIRLGRAFGPRLVARARAAEAGHARRIGRVFADHDVVLSPVTAQQPGPLGRYEGRGMVATGFGVSLRDAPYAVPWNITGQPAAAVPAGLSSRGLPLSVQLVGRPNDEWTLIALAAQVERERPWAGERPPHA